LKRLEHSSIVEEPIGLPLPRYSRLGALSKWLVIIALVAIWQAIGVANSYSHFYNEKLLPSPYDILVAARALSASGALWNDIAMSTLRVVGGVALAAPFGIVLGLAVARVKWFEYLVEPLVEVLRPVPTLALLPMIILWFGIGENSKVLFIAYSCFFVMFTSVVVGVRNIDYVLLRAGQSLGLNWWQQQKYIVIPAIMPDIALGLRLSLSVGFLMIVAAEFVAADSGLGYLINYSRAWFRVGDMLVGAICISILGVASTYALLAVEKVAFPWKTEE
jgi:ABC-type nitrate/sulfonate/bicarbonate transport system permease component